MTVRHDTAEGPVRGGLANKPQKTSLSHVVIVPRLLNSVSGGTTVQSASDKRGRTHPTNRPTSKPATPSPTRRPGRASEKYDGRLLAAGRGQRASWVAALMSLPILVHISQCIERTMRMGHNAVVLLLLPPLLLLLVGWWRSKENGLLVGSVSRLVARS